MRKKNFRTPVEEMKNNPAVTPVITDHGGHVGFVSGGIPGRPLFWAESVIAGWLAERIEQDSPQEGTT